MSIPPPVIEHVAKALYEHRYGDSPNGSWEQFSERKPDVAKIYRENAQVAIEAYRSAA